MTVQVHCPAKVNTFLSVGPPDATGYHPIRTIFQAIGLFDILTISDETGQSRIECDWPELPESNTLTKALRLARELVDLPPLTIHLQKQIPAQSGLGGGSSDAAGLLRALPRFVGDWPWEAAETIAAAVGADVPFFLHGGKAQATGYGERVEPLADADPQWLLIVRPEVGVSTPEAYRRLDSVERAWLEFPADPTITHNDFEMVAPCECTDVIEALLTLGAEAATLCGSGSASFGRFPSEEAARAAQSRFREKSWVVPTLTRKESLWMS